MRQLVIAAVLMLIPFGSVEGRRQAPPALEAWLATAGPYGELWELKVDRNGKCAVESISEFGAKTLRKTFSLTLGRREALHKMVGDVRFFDLPKLMLAAVVNTTVVAGENLTVGSTVWLPAESIAPGR